MAHVSRLLALVGVGILGLGCLGLAAQDAKSPQEEALKKLSADLPKLIKAADSDGNGTLNSVEFRRFAPAVKKAGEAILNELDPTIAEKKAAKDLKKYDKNGDGKLDAEEKKGMEEDLRLKEIKEFDWDGDGKLNERERTAMQWALEGRLDGLFRKIDTDGNGELSQDELAAALSTISGIKIKKAKPASSPEKQGSVTVQPSTPDPCCDIIKKFGGPERQYYSNEHWIVQARPKQVTLGSSVLISRRHLESLAELNPAEAQAFAVAVQNVERRLKEAFGFDKINYLMLMMVDRHVHFHVIPRYSKPVGFGGKEWRDAAWPKAPDLALTNEADASALEAVVLSLRKSQEAGK